MIMVGRESTLESSRPLARTASRLHTPPAPFRSTVGPFGAPRDPPRMPAPTQPPAAFDRRASYTRHVDRQPPVAPSGPAPAGSAYSSETGRTYSLDRLIGKGGFGEVYLATPSG